MLEDRRVKIFLLTLAIALTTGIGVRAFVEFKPPPTPAPSGITQGQGQEIVVYVTGAVVKQGLIKLPPGSRLADALTAAGQDPAADLTNLNLAEKLKDGQKIVVPRQGPPAEGDGQAAGQAPAAKPGGKVNINTASPQELDSLPGIGPTMAERIITYRTQNGRFNTIEELKEVPGIGDKKFADLQALVTVD